MKCAYRGKRILDLLLVIIGLPLWLLGGLLSAIAVRATSRGPILFRQTRIGRLGAPFQVLKFRTMVDRSDNPIFPDPARITVVGELLRRTSLDELPQLVNVVMGQMSIVGPRPALPYQVERYNDIERQRLLVRPGITGLAQVRGRNRIRWEQRLAYDVEYVRRQSLWLDLWILARTALVIVSSEGLSGHPRDDVIARC